MLSDAFSLLFLSFLSPQAQPAIMLQLLPHQSFCFLKPLFCLSLGHNYRQMFGKGGLCLLVPLHPICRLTLYVLVTTFTYPNKPFFKGHQQ